MRSDSLLGTRSRFSSIAASLIMCFFLVIGTVNSILWLLADLENVEASNRLDELTLEQEADSGFYLNNELKQLKIAIAFNPSQSDHFDLLGVLYEWQAQLESSSSERATETESRLKAIEAYRQAITRRPAWPDSWLYLARQKALAGELDEELRFAMIRALVLGNNEPRIQALAVEVIGLSWPFFAGDTEILELVLE